jgi:histidinol dehydrogenase
MRVLTEKKDIGRFLDILKKRASGGSPAIENAVRRILGDVRKKGDKALYEYTKRFDHYEAKALLLKPSEIYKYSKKTNRDVLKAIETSAKRIRKFHELQREESWIIKDGFYKKLPFKKFDSFKTLLGQLILPIDRAGIYVPGGKAAYPSTVLMNVIPAQVAGVREIAVCVPTPCGEINPNVMTALQVLGVREVYRIGGAQAIGALAYGTETIKKVDKIAGPGNIYVAMAKKMVFGEVDIDMIAGPSEILIIADDSANTSFLAADLLSQAEHDELASAVLITNSKKLALSVALEIKKQLGLLKRKKIAGRSLADYGAIVIVKDMEEAVGISNQIAPEHLEIMTKYPGKVLPMIKNAGAIFLGQWTPEPLGDYSAGPNHTLPTGGTARFSSPLGVYDFIKRSSILSFTKQDFISIAKTVRTIADSEGLEAHGNTIRVRMGKKTTR